MKNRLQLAVGILALASLALFGAGCDLNGGGTGDPPEAGTASIRLDGGNAYSGGGAGSLYVDSYASVTFSNGGGADASFAVPAYAWTTNLGTNGATVSTNTAVELVYYGGGGAVEPAAGTLYMLVQNDPIVGSRPNLFKSNGDNVIGQPSDVVTGLRVNGGVTLTLPANDTDGGPALQNALLQFVADVENNGTIKTGGLDNNSTLVDSQGHPIYLPQPVRHGAEALAIDKASLRLTANRILSNGAIVTDGGNATAAESRGGDSGRIRLSASVGFINRGTIGASGGNGNGAAGGNAAVLNDGSSDSQNGIYLWNNGALVNAGAITANGGNGTVGGNAGYVDINTSMTAFNTGAINASGGTGSAGIGGNAYYVDMVSYNASVMNSGAITAKGGDGSAGGGIGAYLNFTAGDEGYPGSTLNSGAINLSGGNATTSGAGGAAAYYPEGSGIYLEAQGRLANSGSLVAVGGSGKGAGNGGNGGDLYLYVDYESPYETGDYNAAGPMQISGDINLAGGGAAATGGVTGGSGGDLDVYADSYSDYTYPVVLNVEFLGYGSGLSANGGNGFSGGSGGDFEIYTSAGWSFDDYFQPPTPSIYNSMPIALRGGSASGDGAWGGHGGDVTFETSDDGSYIVGNTPFPVTSVTNNGSIDSRGGDASGAGGYGYHGGDVYFYGYNKVLNNGAINVNGGNATGAGGTGGDTCYDVEMYSTYDVENNGSISQNGGNATGTNGIGGGHYESAIYMAAGGVVRCNGALSANGGNAAGEGTNGPGGLIDLFSEAGGTVYGSLTAAKGTGGTAGIDGAVWVDDNLLFGGASNPA
jgi:hypothetical protein